MARIRGFAVRHTSQYIYVLWGNRAWQDATPREGYGIIPGYDGPASGNCSFRSGKTVSIF
jgi:hypothetical protein